MISDLPVVYCSHRRTRGSRIDLIVIHTNEGPEGPNSAEGLAGYLARGDVIPGYHFVVDENSAIRCADLEDRVNGAGGVNDRAVHICITGFAAQSGADWHDIASQRAGAQAAAIANELAVGLNVPIVRITDSRPGNRGICGHVDVSRYYSESMGHTDPGANFPWSEFMVAVAGIVDDMFTSNDAAALQAAREASLIAVAEGRERDKRLAKIEDAIFTDAAEDSTGRSRNRIALLVTAATGKDGAIRSRLDAIAAKLGIGPTT